MYYRIIIVIVFFHLFSHFAYSQNEYGIEPEPPEVAVSLSKTLSNGFMVVRNRLGYALKNNKYELLTSFKYSDIGSFSEGLIRVEVNKANTIKIGFINEKGEEIIPCIYEKHSEQNFKNGRVIVYEKSNAGLIDSVGKIIIPFKYKDIKRWKTNSYLCRLTSADYSCGVIDEQEKIIIPFDYDEIHETNVGIYLAKTFKYGWVTINDKNEILAQKLNIESIDGNDKSGFFKIRAYNQYDNLKDIPKLGFGFFQVPDKFIVSSYYEDVIYVNSINWVLVRKENLWGAYDIKKNISIFMNQSIGENSHYQSLEQIKEDLDIFNAFIFKKDEKLCLLNTEGKQLIPSEYDDIMVSLDNRYFIAKNQYDWIIYDSKNKKLSTKFNSIYINIQGLNTTIFHVNKKGKRGILNADLKIIVPCKYERVDIFKNYETPKIYFIAIKGNKSKRFNYK